MMARVDRAAFWEFKARVAECDLAIAKARMCLVAVVEQKKGCVDSFAKTLVESITSKNALVEAFAVSHGLDPAVPFTLEDTDCSVTQGEAGALVPSRRLRRRSR